MVKVYEKTASTRKKQFLERSPGAETPSGNKYTACVWEFGLGFGFKWRFCI